MRDTYDFSDSTENPYLDRHETECRDEETGGPGTDIKSALDEISSKGRICPLPGPWKEIYDILPAKRGVGGGSEPGLPLILGAWHGTPLLWKRLRFQEHLEWAAQHGCLEEAMEFLRGLQEDQWLHLDD